MDTVYSQDSLLELEKRQLELKRKELEYLKFNKLEFYSPYPFQSEYHNDKSKHKSLNSGNRPGKCSTISSSITTVNGNLPMWKIWGRSVDIVTPYGVKPVLSWIRKPPEECYRFVMSDGSWFECPKGHRIKIQKGFVYVGDLLDTLPKSVFELKGRSWLSESCLRVLDFLPGGRASGLRYIRKLQGSLVYYLKGYHLHGGQLLSDEDNVQVFAPSQDDVQQRTFFGYSLGGLANKYIGSPLKSAYHLSNRYVANLILGQFEIFSDQVSSPFFRREILNNQSYPQFYDFGCLESNTQVTSTCRTSGFSAFCLLNYPLVSEGNYIVSVYSVGVHNLFDLEVEGHEYYAGGMVHHNTICGGTNTAYHATGRYPDWWKGTRYDKPILIICGGKSNEKVRDLAQTILLGDPANAKCHGTGFIPLSCIGNSVRKPGVPNAVLHQYVKHYTNGVYDGDSKITFLAYDAEDQAWMGFPADEVWLDEEPPELIMGQATRACIDRGGSIGMTFTPENGRTTVLQMIEEHWSCHKGSWMDASGGDFTITLSNGRELIFKTVYGIRGQKGHLTEEKVRDALKGMLPHQQMMRVMGEPMQGAGLIFSYPQDQIMITPIEIPDYWPRIASSDFGGTSEKSHPSAASWAAIDEENDVIYIYDCFKMFSNKRHEVASRMITRPQWIPMMWPHDGNKEVEGGGTVADEYRKFGVNMFYTHITNPDDEKGEGKGGIKVQPQLIEMNTRFADRRLRVFNTLPEIWEELKNYHTIQTATGSTKIVDREDDLIATIRGICAMKRHAVKEQDVYSYEEEEFEETKSRNKYSGY